MGWVWLFWLVSTVRTHFKSRKEAAQLGWGGPVVREIEEEELDTGPGRNAEELLRSKKRLAAGVYDTCH